MFSVAFKKYLIVPLLGVMCGALLACAQPAKAQTNADLLALINSLMQQIAALQAQLVTQQALEGGFQSRSITQGGTVVTTDLLKVRQSPSTSGTLLGLQNAGSQGTVIAGPQHADGYTWWYVNYVSGVDGWSAQNWLQPMGTPVQPTGNLGCTLKTNKATYKYGDVITFSWTSTGAVYTAFVPDSSGKDSLSVPQEKSGTSGSVDVVANVIGLPSATLKAVAADGSSRTCKVTVSVSDDSTTNQSNIVAYVYEDNATAVISSTNNQVETGKFVINFEVVADDGDIYVSDNLSDSIKYDINGPAAPAKQSVRLDSTADEVNGYYMVSEGDSEDFTLTVFVEPAISGDYQLDLDAVFYTLSPSTGVVYKAALDTDDTFSTPSLDLDADVTSVKGCYNNGQFDSVGTQTTKLVNADGTSSVITDGYYECQPDGTWEKESTYPALTLGTYVGYMDGSMFITTKNISQADALANCKLNANSNPTAKIRCTWNGVTIFDNSQSVTTPPVSSTAPQKNYFSCGRSVLATDGVYADGKLACYGMWDYGNDFGGDVNMCGGYNGNMGCRIATSLCASGFAHATTYYSNSSLTGNSSKLSEVASNLRVTTDVVKNGVAGLWEYTCAKTNDSFGYSSGSVLGASATNLSAQLDVISAQLYSILNSL